MIGQRIESRPGLPWGALMFLAVGIALVAGGLAVGPLPMAVAGALPIAVGLMLGFLGREGRFAGEFTAEGIEATDPPSSIPYASLLNVRAGNRPHNPLDFRKKTCPIRVIHEAGELAIPSRLNVPSHEVYRFLAGKVPDNGSREINPALQEYLERQESYFGPEQVWTYRALTRKQSRRAYGKLRAGCYGLILAGVVWIAYGASTADGGGWIGGGILALLLGVAFAMATLAEGPNTGRMIKGWKKASLVIGPQGMAMVQGDIQGEVRWPELLEIRFKSRPSNFRLHHGEAMAGILLRLKGANILIADLYDRPLYVIHDRIMACSGRSTRPEEVEL